MKKIIAVALTVASLTFGTTYAMMEGTPDHHKMEQKQEKHLEKLKQELNLSQEQFTKIKEIKKQEREEMKNFFVKEHKNPLIEATKSGNFDKEIFQKTMLENAKKMSEIKAKYFEQIFNLLNKDQREKFIQHMNEKMEKMHKMMMNN